MQEYLDETRGLCLNLELIVNLSVTSRRWEYLPLKLEGDRLLLAVVNDLRPESGHLDYLRRDKKVTHLEFVNVPEEAYQQALWAYFGDLRPMPEGISENKPASRTFRVAEVEPAAYPLPVTNLWTLCREEFTDVLGVSDFYTGVLDKKQISNNELVTAAYRAFSEHRPLVLSPDILWTTLLQGLTDHVERNAEQLRHQFVSHQGKQRLNVERPDFVLDSLENPWEEVFGSFRNLIRSRLQPGVAELVDQRFSTTGPVEEAVFSIATMDICKVYFEYAMNCICGIPEITLEGTPEDYQKIRHSLREWSRFGLDWWLQPLDPILAHFERAAAGEVDVAFWNDLYQTHDPVGGGYGGPLERMSGWLARFFPYYGDQLNLPSDEPLFTFGFRSGLSRASVQVNGELDLEFVGGLLATEQRGLALRPRLGWVVHRERDRFIEDERERAIERLRPELRRQFRL